MLDDFGADVLIDEMGVRGDQGAEKLEYWKDLPWGC